MKQWRAVIAGCLAVLFCAGVVVAQPVQIAPEQKIAANQIIRMNPIAGLDPKEVKVKAGTTVIWFNESGGVAEIQFIDKQVTLACKSPTHFVVDDEGVFISSKISPGAVASLCFVQKGSYKYVVLREPRRTDPAKAPRELLEGTITVE
jgi:plastocyanin